ncbi:MAG: alanine--tRNA ligase [Microgenomates group bacterium]
MTHQELRKLWTDFWESRGHKLVPPAPLVLQNDPTTLFTSSGMQPLVPFLLGEEHPLGNRLYNIQPSFRAQDIEEVGDNRHTTFFEMMGNWSLGDYFKKEQIPWIWEFFTEILKLPKEKLYVSIYKGGSGVERDEVSLNLWKSLGVDESHIHEYDAKKNWWSRSGSPDNMPAGEIGGPDSEMFYDFGTPHDPSFGEDCHPNCDCGRFMEIGNSVFIQYKKAGNGELQELSQQNVDYGGGFERILAAVANDPDIFKTDVLSNIIQEIEIDSGKSYSEYPTPMRVVADHVRAAVFMIVSGVTPSNKEQGYVLRRLLRRAAVKMHTLNAGLTPSFYSILGRGVLSTYDGVFGVDRQIHQEIVDRVIEMEMEKFSKSLDNGLKYFKKVSKVDEKIAFDLFQNYGFPFEITQELVAQQGYTLDSEVYGELFQAHQNQSRTASAGTFKGGLADSSEQVLKYHTATHLLHQALRDILGPTVRQEGSNITGERLRFDFFVEEKPTDEMFKKVEQIVNEKIAQKLPVSFKILPKKDAEKIGAMFFFKEKYADDVKVYFVGGSAEHPTDSYSKEFCGGPHVQNTSEIGSITITKVKKIGSNLMRIYAE